MESFNKIFTTATQKVKSTISMMIKNDNKFSSILQDISMFSDDSITYPSFESINEWLKKLISAELIPKPLNEKALAAMNAKGITKSKDPREIILTIVSGSETHVHFAISIPKNNDISCSEFLESINKRIDKNIITEKYNDNYGEYIICYYESDSSLKERDNVQNYIFEELKYRKIYTPDEDDDMVFYF